MGPNLFHQNRTVSWLMSIPRSHSRSSTLRSDSGYFTYIITARRIMSGELLKYRKGLLMTGTYPKPEVAPNDWSDNAIIMVLGESPLRNREPARKLAIGTVGDESGAERRHPSDAPPPVDR